MAFQHCISSNCTFTFVKLDLVALFADQEAKLMTQVVSLGFLQFFKYYVFSQKSFLNIVILIITWIWMAPVSNISQVLKQLNKINFPWTYELMVSAAGCWVPGAGLLTIYILPMCQSLVNYHILKGGCRFYLYTKMIKQYVKIIVKWHCTQISILF